MIPICVIRNGKGPAALLTGGNHGYEYEGPLALYELARNSTRRTSPAPSSSCRR
jgi:N2-acetyl-L-2,4-diaminobutanoate deacetylase